LLDGELIRMPPAVTQHMRISIHILHVLENALATLHAKGLALNLGEVFIETGYHMGESWLTPDVSISHAGQPEGKYLEGAPALAVEVISKRNTAEMIERKLQKYFENGAREAWVFYPKSSSVWLYRPGSAVQVEGTLTSDLLPGISIDVDEVFRAAKAK
jgi:Uma2 family endonuclease